ncbi:MAG: hypothetical protein CMP04_10155 [Xanthomarina sp.]|nr:hypothetical protein [Xanthomarina sp.]
MLNKIGGRQGFVIKTQIINLNKLPVQTASVHAFAPARTFAKIVHRTIFIRLVVTKEGSLLVIVYWNLEWDINYLSFIVNF